jgi:hypothetical protein
MPVNLLHAHKFVTYAIGNKEYEALPITTEHNTGFLYMVKFYVDDFMSLVIPISQDQLRHVVTAVITEIHNMFPLDANNSNNTIFKKKLLKEEG